MSGNMENVNVSASMLGQISNQNFDSVRCYSLERMFGEESTPLLIRASMEISNRINYFQGNASSEEPQSSMSQTKSAPKVNCEKCGKRLLRSSLCQHRRICQNKNAGRSFQCDTGNCTSRFRTRHELSNHIKNVHSEPVDCPFPDCDSRVQKRYLRWHVRMVHEKIKSPCPKCGKKVAYVRLKQHWKMCTSNGSRDFECNESSCSATFKTAHDKSSHVRSVHSPPTSCPVPKCDAVFKKTWLQNHVKRVHGEVEYECQNCGQKIFYTQLNAHLKRCANRK